jgi:hypothetical protein
VYCCSYFKKYNYQIKETGEVITFEGVYAADRGQAAAVTFYTFAGGLLTTSVLSSGAQQACLSLWTALPVMCVKTMVQAADICMGMAAQHAGCCFSLLQGSSSSKFEVRTALLGDPPYPPYPYC